MIKAIVQKTFEIDLRVSGMDVRVQGSRQAVDICRISPTRYHLLLDGHSLEARLIDSDPPGRITSWNVGGTIIEIEIQDDTDMTLGKIGMATTGAPIENVVRAPMPGQVLEVSVKPGQSVQRGDMLLILKAMKMENIIRSPVDGVVRQVLAEPGATVEKQAVLLHF